MKIALVLTVNNEERLLRPNLLYHHAIGIDKAWVYFDGTTDSGKESIKDLPFVELQDSVDVEDYNQFGFLGKFTSQAKEHHTARQCLNTWNAIQNAENEGYDWLISLDADELVVTELEEISNLKAFLNTMPVEVDAVNLKVREVLQAKKNYGLVFKEETRFKTIRNFKRYSQNIFRKFFNPETGSFEKFVYWYGHHTGKMAIRLNRELIPHNPHRFVKKDEGEIRISSAGFLLHYHAYDAQDFIKKYQNFKLHPKNYLSGRRVEDIKQLFIRVVNRSELKEKDLKDYFENYLMFTEKDIKKLYQNRVYGIFPRKIPVLNNITSVAKTFKELDL